ncbi:MAG: M50 family metallopeptidase [Planctomycetota bacterium]|jgi:hypothetical protein
MQRFHQLLFIAALVALSWLAMMAVHELGHIIGAIMTGGNVERVVLHPFTISRTDVSPNPNPAVVVWFGPILGCLIPFVSSLVIPRRLTIARNVAVFFAGFCLVANGAYISIGSFDRVGDCGEMLRTGSPLWALIAFGIVTVAFGCFLWHGLGSLKRFLSNPSVITPRLAYTLLFILLLAILAECAFSPR